MVAFFGMSPEMEIGEDRMLTRNVIGGLAVVTLLTACATTDESSKEGAQIISHRDVDTIPETIRNGEDGFTGVIVYGDRGYTGLVGNAPYPNIRVNGNPIGKCEKRQAMIVPLVPGNHVISAHSENNVEIGVTLAEGDAAYFRCNFMRIGGIIFPPAVLDSVDAETAYSIVNTN
jgi:hypothetical protein